MGDEITTVKLYEEISELKDLFLRRLLDDKVKMSAIAHIKEQTDYLQSKLDNKEISSMIKELLLICDRIDNQDNVDELTKSVETEIMDLLERREIVRMENPQIFDPRFHNAVGTVDSTDEYPDKTVVNVVRHGYLLRDQVFRPADVIVAVDSSAKEVD